MDALVSQTLLYYYRVIRGRLLLALLPFTAISFATRTGSYIVEFGIPAYPGLYPSFLVAFPFLGLRA